MNSLVSLMSDESKQSNSENTITKNSNTIRMSNLAKLNTIENKEKEIMHIDNIINKIKIKYIEFYSN